MIFEKEQYELVIVYIVAEFDTKLILVNAKNLDDGFNGLVKYSLIGIKSLNNEEQNERPKKD
jgi:hypothetical protein